MYGLREKVREARLSLLWSDMCYIGRGILRMELPGKRKRRRSKRSFMDVVRTCKRKWPRIE